MQESINRGVSAVLNNQLHPHLKEQQINDFNLQLGATKKKLTTAVPQLWSEQISLKSKWLA